MVHGSDRPAKRKTEAIPAREPYMQGKLRCRIQVKREGFIGPNEPRMVTCGEKLFPCRPHRHGYGDCATHGVHAIFNVCGRCEDTGVVIDYQTGVEMGCPRECEAGTHRESGNNDLRMNRHAFHDRNLRMVEKLGKSALAPVRAVEVVT